MVAITQQSRHFIIYRGHINLCPQNNNNKDNEFKIYLIINILIKHKSFHTSFQATEATHGK